MKRTTKLFILIGIISLALGIGTGFLIKAAKENKAETQSENHAETQPEIVELPVMSDSANPQGLAPAKKAPEQPRSSANTSNNAAAVEAEDTQESDDAEAAAATEMRERRYND